MRKALALAMIVASFSASAEVYTWKDENGVTHFGNKPPPGQRQERVEIRESSPGSMITDRQRRMMQEREIERRHEERKEAVRQASRQDPEDSIGCEIARERVEEYEIDLRELGRKGYRQWEKDQVESWLEEAERDVERECN